MKIHRTALILTCLTVFFARPEAALSGFITASVKESVTLDHQFRYTYTLTNNSDAAIVEFDVGKNYLEGNSELLTFPSGWTFDGGLLPGTYTTPADWNLSLVTGEGTSYFFLSWSALFADSALQPGQSLSDFSIILPRKAPEYVTSHWEAILDDATTASGTLLPSAAVPEPGSMISLGVGIVTLAGYLLLRRRNTR